MPILIIGGLLILSGILAVYSVSIHESFLLTLKLVDSGSLIDPSNYFYFFRQLRNIAIGIVIAFIAYKIPLKFRKDGRVLLLIVLFIVQLLVFTPVGVELNGARGWLYAPGLGTIQPSELFKLGFVIFMSGRFLRKKTDLGELKGFVGLIVLLALFCGVYLLIPDLGTVFVLGLVALVMYRYAGGKIKFVAALLGVGLVLGVTVGMQFTYIRSRIEFFVNPDVDESGRGIGWQTKQALTAVGAGGFFGKGYGKGLQKFGYIPEAQSDFIFAAFSEEIGLLGNMILLGLYFSIAYFVLKKLPLVRDDYFKNVLVGIVSLILMQTFVNIGVNIKILPLTGLTLPFMSFGGTAMMVNLIEIALIYKILYRSPKLLISRI